jgi:hypothetical protein
VDVSGGSKASTARFREPLTISAAGGGPGRAATSGRRRCGHAPARRRPASRRPRATPRPVGTY